MNKDKFPVEKMCKHLKVGKSSYYKWKQKHLISETQIEQENKLIEDAFNDKRQCYGAPRLTIELHKLGYNKSKSTIARRMKSQGLKVSRKRAFKITTQSGHGLETAPNILNRDFSSEVPGKKWVSDITYVRVSHKWAFLTTVIDLADRMVVGWSLSSTMDTKSTVVAAFQRACSYRTPEIGFIFHSDRGVQYASKEFKTKLKEFDAIQSMSRKGNCWDNAVAESFFKTIKTECIYKHKFINEKQAYSIIFEYIRGWYNTVRIHSALGYISPLQAFINKSIYLNAA